MAKRIGMEVSIAVGEAVKLANADVIAAYPITPQTHIVEHLAELVADGELDAEFIPVESEHSAMSACLGSAAVGRPHLYRHRRPGPGADARGALCRLGHAPADRHGGGQPGAVGAAERLGRPLGCHGGARHRLDSDFHRKRAGGLDNILCAFRIAEDQRVLLPVMVHLDGFHLSHMIEPMICPEQGEVDRFLPPNKYPLPLNPDKPVTMGDFAPPVIYTEAKWAQEVNLRDSKEGHPGGLEVSSVKLSAGTIFRWRATGAKTPRCSC